MVKYFFVSFVSFLSLILLPMASSQAASRFSSDYSDIVNDCSCMENNLAEGQDCGHFNCKDIFGYQVQKLYDGSACDRGQVHIIKGATLVVSLNGVPNKVEWRIANGHPFAIIYRVKAPMELCSEETGPPMQGEKLVVIGLGEYSSISAQIDATTAQANKDIRSIADHAYERIQNAQSINRDESGHK